MCAKADPKPITHWVLVIQDAWSRGFLYSDYVALAKRYHPNMKLVTESAYQMFNEAFDKDMEQRVWNSSLLPDNVVTKPVCGTGVIVTNN